MARTAHRDPGRVGEFLKCVDPLQGVVGKVLNPRAMLQLTSDEFAATFGFLPRPFVVPSRFRDNIYVVFANIPPQIPPSVQFACTALKIGYYLPLKWEPHGTAVEWGVGCNPVPRARRVLVSHEEGRGGHTLGCCPRGVLEVGASPISQCPCSVAFTLALVGCQIAAVCIVDGRFTANLGSSVWGLAI